MEDILENKLNIGNEMIKKDIAIIGGGGAGATAAWALREIHNVTLFESESVIGGHAFSETIDIEGQLVNVDLGVEFFSEKLAPNLCALLSLFKVETFVAPLSFTAVYNSEQDFWSNSGHNGSLWSKIKNECNRFHIEMHEMVHLYPLKMKKMTLGEFIKEKKYSNEFVFKALMPLLTTFSSCKAPILDYSLTFCALSFNMGLLSFFHPTYWRKAKGGISNYLKIITNELSNRVCTNTKIAKVKRNKEKISIYLNKGQKRDFDEVVFATHADTALSLICDPTSLEKEILSKFEYTKIESIFHSDKKILAPNIKDRTYCEFNSIGNKITNGILNGSLTRINNKLDEYSNIKTPLLVTFDSKRDITPNLIHSTKNWKIPILRPIDMINKKKLSQIQGKDRIWFCGTDTSLTGHEGAILSGLVIAERLGARYPFTDNNWAKVQFDVAKGIMGISSSSEKISNLISSSIYSTGKLLGLHKSQISKVLLDLYA